MTSWEEGMGHEASGHHVGPAAAWRPTGAQLAAAVGRPVPPLLKRGLAVVFVGINPGLYSGAVGKHFARPGNRFWPALHLGGWTERVLSPFEEALLLERGVGITNIVNRATATAAELSDEELRAGAPELEARMRECRPRCVAFLGMGAYRTAFGVKRVSVGEQLLKVGGRRVWVLPNPSGLNANYQLEDFGRLFAELREAVGGGGRAAGGAVG